MWNHSSEQEDAVRGWMLELAAIPVDRPALPDPMRLWWKAELLRRWDVERRAAAPIERAEPVQVAMGVVGAVVLLVSLLRSTPTLSAPLQAAAILSVALLVAITVVAVRWQ